MNIYYYYYYNATAGIFSIKGPNCLSPIAVLIFIVSIFDLSFSEFNFLLISSCFVVSFVQ